jgi:hypothetical protein
MMAFCGSAKCTVKHPAALQGACLHLKSPTDDMTNQGLAVTMHAVRRAASARDNPVSQ